MGFVDGGGRGRSLHVADIPDLLSSTVHCLIRLVVHVHVENLMKTERCRPVRFLSGHDPKQMLSRSTEVFASFFNKFTCCGSASPSPSQRRLLPWTRSVFAMAASLIKRRCLAQILDGSYDGLFVLTWLPMTGTHFGNHGRIG